MNVEIRVGEPLRYQFRSPHEYSQNRFGDQRGGGFLGGSRKRWIDRFQQVLNLLAGIGIHT